jgi:hypothetical protein
VGVPPYRFFPEVMDLADLHPVLGELFSLVAFKL